MLDPAHPTLPEFFSKVYRPRRVLGASPKTAELYAITKRHFGRFLGRDAMVSDLDSDRIAEFLSWFMDGRSANTVWGARKQLMALANYAQRRGLLYEVPEVARVRCMRRTPEAYTYEDMVRLVEAARGSAGLIAGISASLFYPCLFRMAYDTGARASAIFALRWMDYWPPQVVFRAETQKNKADHIVKLSAETQAAVQAIRAPPRDMIFPWPHCHRLKYIRIKSIFKAAGLPHGRRDLLQRIRRTTATLMHNNGGDATWQLSHSSDAITRRHYIDPRGQVQAADLLPQPPLPDWLKPKMNQSDFCI